MLFSFEKSYSNDIENYFIQKSRNLNLSNNSEWAKLLFYQNKYFTSQRGMVDGKDFYLSEYGQFNLQSELEETIKSFFAEAEGDNASHCKFPRRLKWLKFYLDDEFNKIPTKKCEKLDDWLKNVNPNGAVLIFSSFYMSNPSSMFGHTFLRIKNSNDPLTDYGINFAANPDTDNAIIYAFKGLTGFFEGKFSLLPYSIKVQEYNNSESRDLWEYELNLNAEQTTNMILSLWEIGDNSINYYYFDENCSYVLLKLIDTANENFHFSDQFLFWVNPADTLRAVYLYPGLIKKVTFRPSSVRRFQYRYSLLTNDEKNIFKNILNEKIKITDLKYQLSVMSVARVLDAVSEYMDYQENLAGTQESKFPKFRNELLSTRASLGVISSPLNVKIPEDERPEQGVPGGRIGLSYLRSKDLGNIYNLEVEPVLHRIDSPSLGYSKEAQIELFATSLGYEVNPKRFFINKLEIVNIISISSLSPPLYPISWNLRAAFEQDYECSIKGFRNECQRYFIAGGTGFSLLLNKFQFFILPQIDLAYQNQNKFEVSMGAFSGIIFRPFSIFVFSSQLEWMNRYSTAYSSWRKHILLETSLSVLDLNRIEGKIFHNYDFVFQDYKFGLAVYWHFF